MHPDEGLGKINIVESQYSIFYYIKHIINNIGSVHINLDEFTGCYEAKMTEIANN
jgi:hypothetical protein